MHRSIKALIALSLIAAAAACAPKSTVATAPVILDTFSIAGSWTGCLVQPHVTCTPISMTVVDTSVTDSTARVIGSGNWGQNVAIHGTLFEAIVSLDATATGVVQGWSFTGVVAGTSLTGNMSVPGNDSTFQATFTKSP
jgi:hypothetical protein